MIKYIISINRSKCLIRYKDLKIEIKIVAHDLGDNKNVVKIINGVFETI